ncbi:MAG: glycosyltransferase family 39 protein [Myxococcaceae bacterium]|nr:glycosyltransferase family 39 protein [Myxococcaceae bacterium]
MSAQTIPAPRLLWPLAVVAVLAFAGLGTPSVGTHPDEGLYVALGLEMFERGQRLTASLDGVPNFVKPPLLYWAMEICFHLFGPSLWAARFFSALCAVALAYLAGLWAGRFHGEAAAQRAILYVGTSLGLLRFGHLAMMDVPLALCLALAVEATWRAVERDSRWLLLAGLATGGGILLKGPIAAVLAAGACIGTLAWLKRALLTSRWSVSAVGLALGVSVPWFLVSASVHGTAFTERFFGQENAGKFSGAWSLARTGSMYGALLVLSLPWVFFLIGTKPGRAMAWGSAIWIAAVLLPYSLPSVQYPHYMVPAIVPVLALAAVNEPAPWLRRTMGVVLGLVTVALFVLSYFTTLLFRTATWPLALVCLIAAVFTWRGRLSFAAASYGLACALMLYWVLPGVNIAPDMKAWAEVKAEVKNLRVATWDQHPGVWSAISGLHVSRVYDEPQIDFHLRNCGLLLTNDAWKMEQFGHHLRTRARWKKLSFEMFRQAPPAQWPWLLFSAPLNSFDVMHQDVALVSLESCP